MTFSVKPLSPAAIEMLGQLYVNGPTWDGNVASKAGRNELVQLGLAWHAHGYAQLTQEGVKIKNKRWLTKRRES